MRTVEKRRWSRFLLDLLRDRVICRLLVNNDLYIEAGLRDVGRWGAGLRMLSDYDRLSRGDAILFHSISRDGDFSILRWRNGRVKWVNPQSGEFGLKFDDPLPYSKMSRRLQDALAEKKPGRLVLA